MAPANKIQIYDTTLRDGCQSEDVSLTLEDKLEIARRLDALGVDYIEGGWPGSNERDAAFFTRIKRMKLRQARIAAFGATRRAGIKASADRNLLLILRADTPVACVVGKTWDMHVREALRVPLQENLEILHDTIAYLKRHVDEVIFDAEHFFDGYHFNPEYALSCLKSVEDAGADLICLCASNASSAPRYPLPQRLRCRNREQCHGGSPRRGSGPGHDQRLWRTVWQRQSRVDYRQPAA